MRYSVPWGYAREIRDRVEFITKNNLKMKVMGAAAKEVDLERTVILKNTTAVYRKRVGGETFYQYLIVV